MRLDLRVGTMAAAAALCLPVVASGQRPVVEGMSQRLTVACGSDGAKVQGTGNTVTLTGPCSTVLVEGVEQHRPHRQPRPPDRGRHEQQGLLDRRHRRRHAEDHQGRHGQHRRAEDAGRQRRAAPAKPQTTAPVERQRHGQRDRLDADVVGHGHRQAGQPDAGRRLGRPQGVDGRQRRRRLDERQARRSGPGRPASSSARSSATAPATGSGLPILVPTNQQVKTMECDGRAVSVQGNGNRLTLQGPVRAGHRRRQREHPRRRLDDADRHVRQPQRREVPRPGQRQGARSSPRAAPATASRRSNRSSSVAGVGGLASPAGPHRPSPPVLSLAGCAPVAQLDRASGFEPGGRGFEPLRAHQLSSTQRPNPLHAPVAQLD